MTVTYRRIYRHTNGIWRLEYERDGMLYHFSLRTRDEATARAKADQYQRDLLAYDA
jgi:hypothetical protein